MHVSAALFKNREKSFIQLSQPTALSLFALSGAIATFGSITLALPEYDAACAVCQPVILTTCVSLMGTILVARAWHIGCLVSSTLSTASSEEARVDRMQNESKQMRLVQYVRMMPHDMAEGDVFSAPSVLDRHVDWREVLDSYPLDDRAKRLLGLLQYDTQT